MCAQHKILIMECSLHLEFQFVNANIQYALVKTLL
jgi:hypothetical protein